jgi:hypothetical protein
VLTVSGWVPPQAGVGGNWLAGLATHLARSRWRATVVWTRPRENHSTTMTCEKALLGQG